MEVKGRGHTAPRPRLSFHQLFIFSPVSVWAQGIKGSFSRVFVVVLFVCCCLLLFFSSFLTVSNQLRVCPLLVLRHDVHSFHSRRFRGDLITLVERGCQGVSLSSLALIPVCFRVFGAVGQDRKLDVGCLGSRRSKRREKSERCQILSDSAKTKQSHKPKHHSDTPPSPPLPFHPASPQSDTLNLPTSLHAPASPRQQLAVRHRHARRHTHGLTRQK